MVKEMGGTLIARKVDCAIVHYESEPETKYIKPCKKKLTKKMTTENEKPTKVQIEEKYQILLQRYNTRVVEERERVIISDEKKKPILEDSTEWGKNRNCTVPQIKHLQEIYSKD